MPLSKRARLLGSHPGLARAQWRLGTLANWATESYGIARLIYGGSHETRALALFYETDFLPVVNLQFEKAGVRLAAALNAPLR